MTKGEGKGEIIDLKGLLGACRSYRKAGPEHSNGAVSNNPVFLTGGPRVRISFTPPASHQRTAPSDPAKPGSFEPPPLVVTCRAVIETAARASGRVPPASAVWSAVMASARTWRERPIFG